MTPRLIAYSFTFIVILITGIFVLLNNKKSRLNQTFFLFLVTVNMWVLSLIFADNSNSQMVVEIASKIAFVSADLMIYVLLLFSFIYPAKHFRVKKITLFVFSIPTLSLALFANSKLVIQSVSIKDFGADVVTGPLYTLFFIYVLLYFSLTVFNFLRTLKKSKGLEKTQILYLLIGILASAILALFTNLVLVLLGVSSLGYLGPPSLLIFIGLTAYAIVRHKLFDIRAVVARSVTYVLTIALIGGVYGFLAFGLANALLQNTSQLFQQTVYTILAIVLAFLFQPIRRLFERVSNAIFYRGKYDAQQLINEIGRIIAGEIQLDQLSHKVIRELAKQMKISSVDIVVLSEKSVHFQTRVFSSEQHNVIVSDLKKLGRLAVVADEITGGDKKAIMKKYGYSVSMALRTSEEFLGYLLLGEKKSGDIYNTEDLQTLKTIANELSVGLQNAKAFAEIQAFNVTLQQKVNEATKNLRHANDQLKELDKAKDEFISMASHQLRTPLTTVKGYVSMLDEGDFGKISKAQREPVEQALDGSNRMARLIDDLLNVSRMEAGRFFIDATEIDLNTVVPQEVEQLQNLAKSKNVELKYIAPAKPVPKMNLDENKTRQVIMNLADNAVHYSQPPKGGGKVEVRLERDGDDIVYVVRDNGIGVPKDQQDKLFTKMFRARNAQELRPDGTGLGLYLVKRVIEDQGGKLLFESVPGKGSMFGFRMPIHNKVVVDKKAQKALSSAHKNG